MKEEIKLYKRNRIIQAASELFYDRGFVGTTLDAVAERLGVKKPFIYQFFRSKHEILAAVVESEIQRVINLIDDAYRLESMAHRRLYRFIESWVRENIEFRQIAIIFWQEHHHFAPETQLESRNWQRVLSGRITRMIEDGVASGEFKVENPRLAAFALLGIAQWIPRWYRADGGFTVDEIAEYFASQALRIVGYHKAVAPVASP